MSNRSKRNNGNVTLHLLTPEAIKALSPEQRANMARQDILLTLRRLNCSMAPYRDLNQEKAESSQRSFFLKLLSLFVKEFRQREIYSLNIAGLPYPEEDTTP